ncbi:MAG: hypothetical protein ACJ752_13545 [Gaiellaceae bacterium]
MAVVVEAEEEAAEAEAEAEAEAVYVADLADGLCGAAAGPS